MKIDIVKIEDLKPASYNPRQMTEDQVKQLTESIKKFGLVDPIIANSNPDRLNIVVGGHQRLKIALSLGFKEVPVVYVNLNEEDERELNLRLNKNLGQWDWEVLANQFDPTELYDVGFTAGELGMYEPKVPSSEGGDNTFDRNKMGDSMDSYLNNTVKQIVLYFKNEEFNIVIPKLEKLLKDLEKDSFTDVFNALLKHYEDTKGI